MARVPAEATAFAHRQRRLMVNFTSQWQSVGGSVWQRGWAEGALAALRPYRKGVYVNFLQDEGEARVREAYGAATLARLVEVKRRYDPTNLFRLNQNIKP